MSDTLTLPTPPPLRASEARIEALCGSGFPCARCDAPMEVGPQYVEGRGILVVASCGCGYRRSLLPD